MSSHLPLYPSILNFCRGDSLLYMRLGAKRLVIASLMFHYIINNSFIHKISFIIPSQTHHLTATPGNPHSRYHHHLLSAILYCVLHICEPAFLCHKDLEKERDGKKEGAPSNPPPLPFPVPNLPGISKPFPMHLP